MVLTQESISQNTPRSFGFGFKPKQVIPETEKTEDWAKENIDWCISQTPIWWKQKTDDYYMLYNGQRSEDQFEHITKTYGIEFPAGKLKHVPLIRPLINRLLSEAEERIFEFTAHSEDDDSIEDKIKQVSSQIISEVFQLIRSQEDADKALDKMQRYYQSEWRSELEISVQRYLNQYMYKHRLDRSFSDNFLDKCITGQEFCRVKVNRIGEDPEYETIRAGELFYADNDVKWVSECDWAIRPKLLTPTEIMDKYGERMKPKDIQKIESWLDMYNKDFSYRMNSLNDADSLISTDTSSKFTNAVNNHRIAVYECEWKSTRKIDYLKNPNKYAEDAAFIKILDNEALTELPKSRRERVKNAYVQDLWGGIRIGDGGSEGIYVDLGKRQYASRSMSAPSKVYLTFEGLTHNGKIKPYSLIGETEDLQNLYDILHYHKENLIALSGVKGSIMDLSQLPDFKTGNQADNIKMYMYYKKLGTAFIDRSKQGADKSYNQFSTYDDTLGAGLQAVLTTIQHLEEVAGRIIGVNRQQLGATQQYDGKSVTQMAQQNSAMVTEYMFNEHDEFVERALTAIAQASRISHKNGAVGHYTDRNSRMQQMFRLDSVNFPYADWGVHITNKSSDKRSIMELKMMAQQMVKDGLMNFEDILPMYKQTSLAEITRQIEVNIIKRREEMTEQQAQLQQMQAQLMQAKGEAEVQKLQAQVQELMNKIEVNQRELQLEQLAIDNKQAVDLSGLELDKKRVELEAKQLDVYAKQNVVKSAEVKNN
jgi:hypothetical protein